MRNWLAGIVGESMATGAMLVIVTLAIVIAFVVLLMIFRGFGSVGVRSNRRTRQARLAVMDAAVVDSKRRLVLIRRDDVEHLVMIGGPSDVVIEQNIKRQRVASAPQSPAARTRQPIAAVKQKPPQQPQKTEMAPAPQQRKPVAAAPVKPQPTPPPQIRPVTSPVAPAVPVKEDTQSAQSQIIPAAVQTAQLSTKESIPVPAEPAPDSTVTPHFDVPTPVTPVEKAPSPSVDPKTNDVEVSPEVTQPQADKISAVEAEPVPENRLAEFEDELAMNLGERLVPAEKTVLNTDLASEMDELLSEITAGSKSRA